MLRRLLVSTANQLVHGGASSPAIAAAVVAPAFARRHSSDSAGRRPSQDESSTPTVLAATPEPEAVISAVDAAPAPAAMPTAAADLQLLVHHLRALEARDQRAKRGDHSPSASHAHLAAKRLANPLTPRDHPLLTDDFALQTPFIRPAAPDASKVFGPFEQLDVFGIGKAPRVGANGVGTKRRQAMEDAAHERAAVALVGHPDFPYLLAPTLPLLPIKPTAVAAPLPPGAKTEQLEAGAEEEEGQLTMQLLSPVGATDLPPGILAMQQSQQQADEGMLMTSVLRKRRKRMNKHKLRKLRKRTRAQRK